MKDKIIPLSYNRIVQVRYSPSGKYLAFAGGKCLFIFYTANYSLYNFILAENRIKSFLFSPKEDMIISAFEGGKIKTWEFPGCELQEELEENFNISYMAVDEDGKFLICGGEEGEVALKSFTTLKTLHSIKAHSKRINSLAFSQKGYAASAGSDKILKVWKIKKIEKNYFLEEAADLRQHNDEVLSVLFNDNEIISGGEDGVINFWDLSGGTLLKSIKKEHGITSLILEKKKNLLYYASSPRYYGDFSDDLIEIYDLIENKNIQSIKEIFSGLPSIALHPDGKEFAGGGFGELVRIWKKDKKNYSLYNILKNHSGTVRFISYVNNMSQLISASSEGRVILWDTLKGNIINKINTESTGVKTIEFSPSSSLAAISLKCKFNFSDFQNKYIKILNLSENKEMCRFSGHSDEVSAIAFNSSETKIVSGGKDRAIIVWSLETQEGKILGQGKETVGALCFNRKETMVASGCSDGIISLWDIEKKCLLKEIKGHEGGVTCLYFSSSGKKLFSGGYDSRIHIWDSCSFKLIETIKVPWSVRKITLSPEEKYLAVITNNGIIQIWDLEKIKVLKNFKFKETFQWQASVRFINEEKIEIADYQDGLVRISKFNTVN